MYHCWQTLFNNAVAVSYGICLSSLFTISEVISEKLHVVPAISMITLKPKSLNVLNVFLSSSWLFFIFIVANSLVLYVYGLEFVKSVEGYEVTKLSSKEWTHRYVKRDNCIFFIRVLLSYVNIVWQVCSINFMSSSSILVYFIGKFYGIF